MTLWFRWSPERLEALSAPPAGTAKRFSPSDLEAPTIDAKEKSVTFCTLTPNAHLAIETKLDELWEEHQDSWEEFEREVEAYFAPSKKKT
jgi:hypothetical protein